MKKLMTIILVIGLLGIGELSSNGNTISYTNTSGELLTDINTNLTIPKFNSSLGTLDSAALSLNLGIQTQWTFTSLGHSSSIGIGTSSGKFTIESDLNFPTNENYSFGTFNTTVPAYSTTNSPIIADSFNLSLNITNRTILNELTIGDFADIISSTSSSVRTSGNTYFAQSTEAIATVVVIYTFDPTPEPSTIALIGLGISAFVAYRRRHS